MAGQRIGSFREFFPYYLGEHRVPLCRVLHFLGTSIGLSMLAYIAFFSADPTRGLIGIGGIALALTVGTFLESRFNTAPIFLLGVASLVWGSPVFGTIAIVSGYAFPWIGHFVVEGNRPATFKYPTWSFVSDLRMFSMMITFRLWAGDTVREPAAQTPNAA